MRDRFILIIPAASSSGRATLAFIRIVPRDTGFTGFLFHQSVVLALPLGWALEFDLDCRRVHSSTPYVVVLMGCGSKLEADISSPISI
jgi:hypothetical protein